MSFYFWNQCRKETDPSYNDSEFQASIDFESIYKFTNQFQSRCVSDPPLSDNDFKKRFWSGLPLNCFILNRPYSEKTVHFFGTEQGCLDEFESLLEARQSYGD